MCKIRLYFVALAILFSGESFAGGILTNTNTSVAFNRNFARDGVIAIDGVYSNPAGVSFMPQGWHLSFTNQSVKQTRTIKSGMTVPAFEGTPFYQPFKLNGGDESGVKTFEGVATAPILPSFQLAHVGELWTLQASFAMVGGGGKCTFNHGLGSFERTISLLPAIISQVNAKYAQFPELAGVGLGLGTTTPGYSLESYIHGQQYVFGLQLGTSYKISDHWSVYGGFRFNYVYNKYEGNIRNISVNIAGENQNLAQYVTDALPQLSQVGAMLQGKAQEYSEAAKQLQDIDPAKAADAAVAAAQYAKGAQDLETVAAMHGLVADKNLDCTQRGWAICPIIGADFRYGKLNIGARIEFTTHFNIENDTKVDDTGLFADGVNTPGDMPGIATIGAQYEVLPQLRVMAGAHYFFDKNAHMADDKQKHLSHNTWEWNAGVEYDLNDKIMLSCGGQKTNYGLGDGTFLNDMSFVTSSYSLGLGGSIKITEKMKFNIAYFQTFYDKFDKSYSQTFDAAGQSIAADCTDQFTRTNKVFAIGVDVDF